MRDIFQEITSRIITQLEAGTAPWVRPWSGEPDPVPVNGLSRKPYRGLNRLSLQLEAMAQGFEVNRWLTFRQAIKLGGHVQKGAHGIPVVFWQMKPVDKTEPAEERSDDPKVIPFMRIYFVHHVSQIEGLSSDHYAVSLPPCWDGHAKADGLLQSSGATIEHAGFRAYYDRRADLIRLPRKEFFPTVEAYAATALHELGHWTGSEARCNREFGKRFGDEAYAFEELVAELTAAFLCATCRIDGRLEHAAYISSWLRILQSDKRAVLLAAAKAQQAADYILALGAKDDEPAAMQLAA